MNDILGISILICPALAVTGWILGIIGLFRIRLSGRLKKGKSIAITGFIISTSVFFGWVVFFQWFASSSGW
jgi:hypothetical protein